jgi:hypothetical protein
MIGKNVPEGEDAMQIDMAMLVFPVLMVLAALVPVALGLRDYYRSR